MLSTRRPAPHGSRQHVRRQTPHQLKWLGRPATFSLLFPEGRTPEYQNARSRWSSLRGPDQRARRQRSSAWQRLVGVGWWRTERRGVRWWLGRRRAGRAWSQDEEGGDVEVWRTMEERGATWEGKADVEWWIGVWRCLGARVTCGRRTLSAAWWQKLQRSLGCQCDAWPRQVLLAWWSPVHGWIRKWR